MAAIAMELVCGWDIWRCLDVRWMCVCGVFSMESALISCFAMSSPWLRGARENGIRNRRQLRVPGSQLFVLSRWAAIDAYIACDPKALDQDVQCVLRGSHELVIESFVLAHGMSRLGVWAQLNRRIRVRWLHRACSLVLKKLVSFIRTYSSLEVWHLCCCRCVIFVCFSYL